MLSVLNFLLENQRERIVKSYCDKGTGIAHFNFPQRIRDANCEYHYTAKGSLLWIEFLSTRKHINTELYNGDFVIVYVTKEEECCEPISEYYKVVMVSELQVKHTIKQ